MRYRCSFFVSVSFSRGYSTRAGASCCSLCTYSVWNSAWHTVVAQWMLTELLKIVWLACDFYLFYTELLLLVTCESSLFIEDVSTLFFLFFFLQFDNFIGPSAVSSRPHWLSVDFWRWWRARRYPKCRACLASLHLRYIFWTTAHGSGVGHSWFLWPRRLCWAWCRCARLGFPYPSFMANFRISLSALGPCFLKPTSWMHSWMLMVYSLVTASLMVNRPFFSTPFFAGAILQGQGWKGVFDFLKGICWNKCCKLSTVVACTCSPYHLDWRLQP